MSLFDGVVEWDTSSGNRLLVFFVFPLFLPHIEHRAPCVCGSKFCERIWDQKSLRRYFAFNASHVRATQGARKTVIAISNFMRCDFEWCLSIPLSPFSPCFGIYSPSAINMVSLDMVSCSWMAMILVSWSNAVGWIIQSEWLQLHFCNNPNAFEPLMVARFFVSIRESCFYGGTI